MAHEYRATVSWKRGSDEPFTDDSGDVRATTRDPHPNRRSPPWVYFVAPVMAARMLS